MPLTLPNLYCLPNDVFDQLGTEGVQLRLDDHGEASAQQVFATATAALGTTSIQVVALAKPILKGTSLSFDGGGMPAVITAVLSSTALVGDTTISVVALEDAVYAQAGALDSGVNVALAARLVKACRYATSQVKMYCTNRYNDSDLYANSTEDGSVKRWAVSLASRWIAKRRAQAAPQGIESDWEETMEEMKAVKNGQLSIEDIGTRTSGWPFFTNVTVDHCYALAKVRVEPQISEQTPTQYGQLVDWNTALLWVY